ncbi:MAG: hypothetical protein EXR79_14770 [Myxococcales bacterium]|nr:hypothetical protein [Myxococcales bacterium]
MTDGRVAPRSAAPTPTLAARWAVIVSGAFSLVALGATPLHAAAVPTPGQLPAAPLPTGPVTVRLFLDLECPHSRQAWPLYRSVVRDAGPAVTLVVHHLPLSRHPHARDAALAALGARAQGREAEFIDKLFESPVPDAVAVQRAAAALQLDTAAHARSVGAPETVGALDRERQAGLAFGIRATPSALINGRGVAGTPPEAALHRALLVAQQAAGALGPVGGAGILDVEREGLVAQAPEFVAAFDALRAGRGAIAASPAQPGARGRLGERWRVELLSGDVVVGADAAPVVAAYFFDPSVPWQVAHLRGLLHRTSGAGPVRIALKFLPRVGSAQARDGVAVALRVHAMAHAARDAVAPVLALAAQQPSLTVADLDALSLRLGVDVAAIQRAAEQPAITVAVQATADQARRLDARPGTLFLNGRRWLGLPDDAGLTDAIAEMGAEATALARGGASPAQAYAQLVAPGRWLAEEELDLGAPEPLGELPQLPVYGAAGPTVTLFVDFASPHSRAAWGMVRRLLGDADAPIRLRVASIASTTGPCISAAGAAFVTAHAMGKGLAYADRLFEVRAPDEWPTLFGLARKLKLPLAAFQQQVDGPAARATARAACDAAARHDLANEPVLFVADRFYSGPLDEARIERAIRFAVRTGRATPAAGAP